MKSTRPLWQIGENMTRANNKNDMTISEQLEAIKNRMCDDYCKMPEHYLSMIKDPDEANDVMIHAECIHCPLSEL